MRYQFKTETGIYCRSYSDKNDNKGIIWLTADGDVGILKNLDQIYVTCLNHNHNQSKRINKHTNKNKQEARLNPD